MNYRRTIVVFLLLCVYACFTVAAEPSSKNNDKLKKLLERYPKADANGDGVLTLSEARAFLGKNQPKEGKDKRAAGQKRPAPSFANVKYGPHERNVLDIYQAKSGKPTPLVVYIHGGGFVGGDKKSVHSAVVDICLRSKVSVAAINYRFRKHAPIQDILRDSGRAIQFLRYNCAKWNIDKTRIVSYGGSAGAGTSLWLAFHDDLANPKSKDPVLRESSRLSAAGSLNGQCTYDLKRWEEVLGKYPGKDERMKETVQTFYWMKDPNELDSPEGKRIRADVDMLGLLSKGDAPVFLYTSGKNTEPTDHGHYVHHPRHSIAVKNKCKRAGVPCLMLLRAEDAKWSGGVVHEEMLRFFFKHLKVKQ